jgi:hypothetical protein
MCSIHPTGRLDLFFFVLEHATKRYTYISSIDGNNPQGSAYGAFYVYRMGTKGQYQLIQRITPAVSGSFSFAENMGLSGNGKVSP